MCFNEAVGYYRRNRLGGRIERAKAAYASMRPSDITDGISLPSRDRRFGAVSGFNEAVGYYRRNLAGAPRRRVAGHLLQASMRPSDITDGIWHEPAGPGPQHDRLQ